jgi:hypothetical protein
MTNLANFLASLSDSERDYIASLDCNREADEHRRQFDIVIANGGHVDFDTQLWHPYEVLDLGKHCMSKGHEREFVACNSIVLLNISTGKDICNQVDWVYPNFLTYKSEIDADLVTMVEKLGQLAKTQSEQ